jgi:hypothetical protein
MTTQTKNFLDQLKPFENKWVAFVDDKLIASGDTVAEVKRNADAAGTKEYSFYLVPSSASSFAPALVWG